MALRIRRRRSRPAAVRCLSCAKGDLSRHETIDLESSAIWCHRFITRRPRALRSGWQCVSRQLRQLRKPRAIWRCCTLLSITTIRSSRHVRRFHLRAASHRSGCIHRCITSTSLRSQSVSTCCTSSLVRPGFQHERSRLLRKSAAHSSSAILGAAVASAVFFLAACPAGFGVSADTAAVFAVTLPPPNSAFFCFWAELEPAGASAGAHGASVSRSPRLGGAGGRGCASGSQETSPPSCAHHSHWVWLATARISPPRAHGRVCQPNARLRARERRSERAYLSWSAR